MMKCPQCGSPEVYCQDRDSDIDTDLCTFRYRCEECECEWIVEEIMYVLYDGKKKNDGDKDE